MGAQKVVSSGERIFRSAAAKKKKFIRLLACGITMPDGYSDNYRAF